MPSGPPARHRRRLGETLRTARKKRNLTELQAAEAADVAQSWINSVENAKVQRINMAKLNKVIAFLEFDTAVAEQLREWARLDYDHTGAWIDPPNLADSVLDRGENLELEARAIKSLHLEVIDGLLQCEAYMRRQYELSTPVNVESRVHNRLDWQEAFYKQPTPPQLAFLVTESALHTDMGEPGVMVKQIEHLLDLTERDHVTILVKPFGAVFPTSTYDFTVFQFSSHTMYDYVWITSLAGKAVIDDDDAVRFYHARWDAACSASLSEHESRQKLREVLEHHTTRSGGQ